VPRSAATTPARSAPEQVATAGSGDNGGPRWHRLRHEDRRAQILHEASVLFSKRSYSAVSMEDIAAAAGVRRGLLNHYFGTKRHLYLDVIRDMTRLPPAATPPGRQLSTADVVAHNVELYLDAAQRNRVAWLAMSGGSGFGRDREIERLLDEVEEAYVDRIIEIFGGQPRLTPDAQRAALRCYAALAKAVSREWLAAGRLSREQARVLLTESLVAIVGDISDKVLAVEGRTKDRGAYEPVAT
jgi:AcrR family transcriptional regulator